MSLGNKLLNLRKEKGLSQEEVAEKLNVSRQTISKWETDQSTPDFDKIIPLCELYEITSDELLKGKLSSKDHKSVEVEADDIYDVKSKAKFIGCGVILYFVAVAWIMTSIPVYNMNPITSSAVFILICGVATYLIIYANMVYGRKEERKRTDKPQIVKIIETILSLVTVCIYLFVSFYSGAWFITWIIWIVYAIVVEIIKLIFCLRGVDYEE